MSFGGGGGGALVSKSIFHSIFISMSWLNEAINWDLSSTFMERLENHLEQQRHLFC